MKSKSATLEDVARHAGVSYQTVSRVLNKSANVSEATRRKVEKSIEALRYVPNRLAQQLVGKESQTVGLVTISLAWHAPSQVATATSISTISIYATRAGSRGRARGPNSVSTTRCQTPRKNRIAMADCTMLTTASC